MSANKGVLGGLEHSAPALENTLRFHSTLAIIFRGTLDLVRFQLLFVNLVEVRDKK